MTGTTQETEMITESKHTIAVPPGETLKEMLKDRELCVLDFASKAKLPVSQVCALLDGDLKLTPKIARHLEQALYVPASFWLNLEKLWRDDLGKINRGTSR